MSTSLSEQDFIQLNAYLDGELPAGERKAFEARLAGDVSLRQEFEALRVTVSLVGMAERVPVPRNFTLDPAVYGKPARRSGLPGLWPVLSTAGAALSTLLVCAGLLLSISGGRGAAMAPSAEVGEVVAADEAAQPQAPAAQVFEEPVEEEAGAEEAAPTEEGMEEAPLAMEAAPAEEQEAPAEEAAPALEAEEQAMPTPNPTGVGGGMPPGEAAEEPAADAAEGEAAAPGPMPTLTPLALSTSAPTMGAGERAAVEGNGAEVAEAPPQPEIAAQEQLETGAAAAQAAVPTRTKYGAAPLPVILLVVGGLGLAVSLAGLVITLRRRR